MTEGKLLQRAALAGLVAVPLAASSAAVLQGGDETDASASSPPACRGCGGASGFAATTPGECGTRWCQACIDLTIDTHPAAQAAVHYDCVIEGSEP